MNKTITRIVSIAQMINKVFFGLAVAWTFAPGAASAQGAAAKDAGTQKIEINNCVGGPAITLAADDKRALLDESEREALLGEMLARYPILARDGFAPPVILMWRKAPETVLYVGLRPNAFTNNGTLCFTATFVAKVFEITPGLTRKYFEAGAISDESRATQR